MFLLQLLRICALCIGVGSRGPGGTCPPNFSNGGTGGHQFFFFYKKFTPNAKVTYSSRVLIQGMQPKDKEKRDRDVT